MQCKIFLVLIVAMLVSFCSIPIKAQTPLSKVEFVMKKVRNSAIQITTYLKMYSGGLINHERTALQSRTSLK